MTKEQGKPALKSHILGPTGSSLEDDSLHFQAVCPFMGAQREGWLSTKTSLVGKLSLRVIPSIYPTKVLLGLCATRDRRGYRVGVKSCPPQTRTTHVTSIMLLPGTLAFPNA